MTEAQAIGLALLAGWIAAGAAIAHIIDRITPHPKDGDDQP